MTVALLGTGLIGGSIGLALRQRGELVVGYDVSREVLRQLDFRCVRQWRARAR